MTRDAASLLAEARAWHDADPDPATQRELAALIANQDLEQLRERLHPLSFGTAGLRGAVAAGPGRMNLAVVLRAAHGIARYLASQPPTEAPIVIGFDARPSSRGFAEASAGVLLAAGFRVVAFKSPTATPLCAFLGRELQAPITIVVTASHNPRGDNGYKVYGANAVQIIAPVDRAIAEHIAEAPAARHIPAVAVDFDAPPPAGLELRDGTALNGYFDAISRAIPANTAGRELGIVHSALHGVGTLPMRRALAEAGFQRVAVVSSQAEPDGSFPTTPFPNPEEPGTLDLALAEAERQGAALLLVSDPDADRLAAAARLEGALEVLDGNQVGALLADFMLTRCTASPQPLVLSSVVSSPLVAAIAAQHGARHERTHTGFKWLWNAALALEAGGAAKFCFAYEEALGYSVFSAVRDKDGIAAGRALAELAAELSARGSSLYDRLFEHYAQHGLWASAARNVALRGPEASLRVSRVLDALTRPGLRLGSDIVTGVVDYRDGSTRPVWLGAAALLELELESGGRVLVRPSGTEPKLKLYGHVRRSVTRRSDFKRELGEARRFAAAQLLALEAALQL
ncbi:MAG TPA: phospho-sugar mutase [Polyangiaceae bacterium]|nr:phospho-sugar mutase [Polyangiaceae bacterium]